MWLSMRKEYALTITIKINIVWDSSLDFDMIFHIRSVKILLLNSQNIYMINPWLELLYTQLE